MSYMWKQQVGHAANSVVRFFERKNYPGGGVKAGENEKVHLCYCKDCSFSFYDRRLTDEEAARLYDGYRGEEYQRIREKYDCWYTAKVNYAMNHDAVALKEQRRVIDQMVTENIRTELQYALDFGGNKGESFTKQTGTKKKYVYDISGVETIPGVENIADYSELARHSFDFVMCNMTLEHVSEPKELVRQLFEIGSANTYYYVEVPSENPFEKNKFSVCKNLALLANPYYSNIRLVRHYLHIKKQPYMPMSEHINFYTPKSLKTLMVSSGFEVIDVQENQEKGVLGKTMVLSAICKKRSSGMV